MKKLITSVLMALCSLAIHSQVVSTMYGQIQGSLNGSIYQFLGIPYAKPPVAALRWKAPQNPDTWSGVLQANSFAPVCPQKRYEQGDTTYTLEGKEDCLFLNIWTPKINSGSRAVMVFIHGGGNQQGGASQITGGTQIFFGKNLAERGDVVVVTIQYRLGSLGYLVHPGLEVENSQGKSGNFAVLDQILALQWIKNNITNFGGDPAKVMIFGESAGGLNVGNLLATPLAKDLFQRACIQSAAPVINEYNDSKNKGVAWVDSFVTQGTDIQKIAHMRALDADSLLFFDSNPLSGGAVQMNWQPVLDKVVFNDHPIQIFQSGNFNKVPLLIGSNSEEMSLSAPLTVLPAMVTAIINARVPPAFRTQALAIYPPGNNPTEAKASYVNILSDAQFTSTSRRTAQCVSLNQTEPVWRYFFTHKHTIPQLEAFGSYHGMELFYVFNTWENATLGKGGLFKPADDSVQKVMLDYWVNFAKSGNPNNTGLELWPQYQSSNDCYLEIKATPNGKQCGLRTTESDFWDDVAGFTACKSTLGMHEIKNTETLLIYPNPSNSIIHVDCKNGFQIVNSLGQLVKNGSEPCSQINISDLPAGIYFLKIDKHTGSFIKAD